MEVYRIFLKCGWVALLAGALLVACSPAAPTVPQGDVTVATTVQSMDEPGTLPPLRLFLVDSYSGSDMGSQQMRAGVLETLRAYGYGETVDAAGSLTLQELSMGLDVEQDPELVAEITQQAIADIQAFAPDVVLILNEEAALEVIPAYPDPNQSFVFCGFHGDVRGQGLNRPNVTGVLEEPKPLQTIRMATSLVQDARNYMVLSDRTPSGMNSASAVYREILTDDDLNVAGKLRLTNNWQIWQQYVLKEASDMDFILLVQTNGLRDSESGMVSSDTVLRWTLENSPVPVFSLWLEPVSDGAVGGLTLSNYEEGATAAEMVWRIARGAHPSSVLVTLPERNVLAMNLAAAEYWDLQIPFEFLVAAQIYQGPGPLRR